MNLIEVLIVISIMTLIAATAAISGLNMWKDSQKKTAKLNASELRHAVGVWRMSHPGEECPSVARLRADKITDKESKTEDPWGSPYTIVCTEDDDITVISPGPDKKVGTPDDIVAPPEAKVAEQH
jgi:hypothetical protein